MESLETSVLQMQKHKIACMRTNKHSVYRINFEIFSIKSMKQTLLNNLVSHIDNTPCQTAFKRAYTTKNQKTIDGRSIKKLLIHP